MFAFVARQSGSDYYNGEYFIVMQTPHTLFGVKLAGGYGGHELRTISLAGSEAYTVVGAYQDDAAARVGIDAMKHFAGTPQRGEKEQWVSSVYSACAANARLAENAIKARAQQPTEEKMEWGLTAVIHLYNDGTYTEWRGVK